MTDIGRWWTEEATDYLKENYGKKSYKAIAKALGKSVEQVKGRARYIGLGATFDADAHLTLTMVYKALFGHNPSARAVNRLLDEGFPVQEKRFGRKRYRLVDPEAMWKWLKKHQEDFDFVRLDEYSLGAEPQWVRDKRKADWAKYNKIRWGINT